MDTHQSQPVDFEAALEQFDGDRGFMIELFKDYESHLPTRMKEIHAAFEAGDTGELFRHAHNLKGVSLTFCANPIIQIARQIEEASKRSDMANMPAMIAQLDEEMRRLQEYLASNLPR